MAVSCNWEKPFDAYSFKRRYAMSNLIYYIDLSSYVIHKNG